MKAPVLSEYSECLLLVDYLNILLNQGIVVKYTHIPNETYTAHWNVKMKNKRMGVRTGFPDYIIMGKTKVICIEMKKSKNSTTSPEQWEWVRGLTARGIPSFVCKGFQQAKDVIDIELRERG